ncbi:MAG TPA: hypothetical protein VEW48_28420 [Thermoanaerobaculia bacterium]|nr:hypothetical protein [Thermoanaerobaculia bacterium]
MRRGRQGALGKIAMVTAAVAFLACQQQTPEQELIRKTDAVGPWLAALQMAGEKWTVNSVPARFVRTSVDAAQKAFTKAARETGRSAARAGLRDHLGRLIAGGQAESARLRQAVAAQDRRAAVPAIRALAALSADFEALSKSVDEPSP